ncbi:MAG: DUF711 family protein, partial [Duodenibacillus sp.]
MLTDREVLSTINMLRSEHLDVRTVTLGINLFDCASHDFDVFEVKLRSKIRKYAKRLVETCDAVGDRYGIPVVNKRISISPMGTVGASFSRDQMVRACQVLDECAKE